MESTQSDNLGMSKRHDWGTAYSLPSDYPIAAANTPGKKR